MNFILGDKLREKTTGKLAVIIEIYLLKTIYSGVANEYVILRLESDEDRMMESSSIEKFYELYRKPGKFKII